jgi:hypothetical protein
MSLFGLGRWGVAVLGICFCAQGVLAQDDSVTGEVVELRRQVKYLSSALAAARIEADARLSVQGARVMLPAEGGMGEVSGRRVPENVRVADVNADLRMVVLGSGRRQGVTPGMVFAVLRDGRKVSRVRVVDVRPAVAGAVIEETVPGFFPLAGDRVLLEGQRE